MGWGLLGWCFWGACFWVFAFGVLFWFNSLSGKQFLHRLIIRHRLRENKEMAKTTTATPSKAKASTEADASLVSEFVAVVGGSLESEFKAFWKLHSQMAQGFLAVRGAQATIKEAEKVGSLPSFSSAWAEHVLTVGVLSKIEGGDKAPLKRLFAVSTQGRKVHKAEGLNALISKGLTLEEIEATIPAQGKRGEGKQTSSEKDKESAKPVTVSDLIAQLGGALKGGAKVEDTKKARMLVAELQKAIKNAEAVQGVKAVRPIAA
jgi:hypothetical protein